MRRVVTRSTAVRTVILFFTLTAFISVWPMRMWHRDIPIEASMNDTRDTSGVINDSRFVQQQIIAPYDRLESIDVMYMGLNRGRYLEITVLDEAWDEVFTRYVDLEGLESEVYINIPLGVRLTVNKHYLIRIAGVKSTFRVGYIANVNGGSYSGMPSIGTLYYQNHTVDSFHLDAVFHYRQPIDKKLSILIMLGIVVLGALLCFLTKVWYGKHPEKDTILTEGKAVRLLFTPMIAAGTLFLMINIFPLMRFGRNVADILFYETGVLIAGLTGLYAVWHKEIPADSERKTPALNIRKAVMVILLGLAMSFCCEFMNATAVIFQSLAERRQVICLLLFLILTMSAKEFLKISNLVILVAGTVCGLIYRHLHLIPDTEKEYDLKNSAMTCSVVIVVLSVFLLWNLITAIFRMIRYRGREKKGMQMHPSIPCILALALAVATFITRNGRWWGPVLAIMTAAAVYRYAVSDLSFGEGAKDKGIPAGSRRMNDWLRLIASGLTFNFFCSVLYSLLYRAFPAFNMGRFPFVFHTVTVTAEYLTVMACVAVTWLINGIRSYHGDSRLISICRRMWKEMTFFGIVSAYLIMTLSRTGIFAFGLTFIFVFIILAVTMKQRRVLFMAICAMTAGFVICFPMVFTLQRIIPPLYKEPRVYLIEKDNPQINGAADMSSSYYMNTRRFVQLFGEKLLGIEAPVYNNPDDRYNYYPDGNPIYGDNGVVLTKTQSEEGITDWYRLIKSEETSKEDRRFLKKTSPFVKMKRYERRKNRLIEAGEWEEPEKKDEEEEDIGSDLAFDSESMFNGRLFLFGIYLSNMNAGGHEEVGIELPNGQLAIHAHNSYIQTMYDAGVPAGILFILLVMLLLIYSARIYRRAPVSCGMILLSFTLISGFAVAGLSEWVFQFSNPMTMSAMLAAVPVFMAGEGMKRGDRRQSGKASGEAAYEG